MEDWIEDLAGFPQRAIEEACKAYRRDEPRRRPTPGDIRSRVLAELAKAQPKRDPDEWWHERRAQRVTPEQAAAILAEVGYTPERLAQVGPKRMPGVQPREMAEIMAEPAEPRPETVKASAVRMARGLG